MKYREIKLEGNKSILVDESAEIKEGDKVEWFGKILDCNSFSEIDNQYYIGNNFENIALEPKTVLNKVIATINHSISLDVPMIIVEDEIKKFLFKLCYYDLRNPDNCINTSELTKEELVIPQVHGKDFANALCSCDNCFYGKTEMAEYIINKATQEKNVYSKDDLEKSLCKMYSIFMDSDLKSVMQKLKSFDAIKQNIIQSLNQEYIELEMDEIDSDCNYCNRTIIEQSKGCPNMICFRQWVKTIKTIKIDGQLMAYIKK